MSKIEEVRERLELSITGGNDIQVTRATAAASDLRALLADHERLQAKVGLAAELLERLDEYARSAPEKGCGCHISPPCVDCVDWGDRRELAEHVIEFVAEHGNAVQS